MYNNGASITREIIFLNLLILLLQVLFFLLGTAISAISKNTKTSGSIATGVILATYFLSVMIGIDQKLSNFAFLSPFTYFEAKDIFLSKPYDLFHFILTGGLILAFGGATFWFYNKKDIPL
jgi:ABC-2 type transport system permease protein